jgi:TonB family protein
VFLDKIQSGFLLFETPQGLARIVLSPRQRISLLWTFRNFRQLSMPLLNPRERDLVNSLFRNNPEIVSDDQDPSLVIGVIEHFVPSIPLTLKTVEQETTLARPMETAASLRPVSASSLLPARPELATVEAKAKTSELATAQIAPLRLNPMKRKTIRLATSRLATSFAALCLCVGSVAAWHRIQGLPDSQAYDQPQLQQNKAVAATNSPTAAEAETRAEGPIAEIAHDVTSPVAASEPVAAPEAALKQTAITGVVPTAVPTNIAPAAPPPKQAIGVHNATSTTSLPLSTEDRGIQASRPPVHFVYPEYSDVRARGVVSLKAGLDSAGNVRTVKLISGNRALAAAALRAVRQWRYRPYLKDGEPVATETYIVISFISDDAVSMTFPPSISAAR